MKRHTRWVAKILSLVPAAAVVLASTPAHAIGEDQINRGFAAVGVGVLFPLSDNIADTVDASFALSAEGGYIIGIGKVLAIAPTLTLNFSPLNEDNDLCPNGGCDLDAWIFQLLFGAKIGVHRKGLFAYGSFDMGLNHTEWEFTVLGFRADADETDFMIRFGGGADYSVWTHLAVGGYVAVPLIFSDNTDGLDGDVTALEVKAYAKFLFP